MASFCRTGRRIKIPHPGGIPRENKYTHEREKNTFFGYKSPDQI
jgi:hypothetical protein